MDGDALLAVAGGLFERVKHLFGSTTVTGGRRGGAALCKQPLMVEPLSGCCVSFCVFSITATCCVAAPGAHFQLVSFIYLFFILLCSSFKDTINSSYTISGLFHHLSFFLHFTFLFLKEIDWPIWLDARFLARGKQWSDMTTCRNNNRRSGYGQKMQPGSVLFLYLVHTASPGYFQLKYSLQWKHLTIMFCPFLSVLWPSLLPTLLLHSRLFCLLISNSTWSAGSRLSKALCSVVYRCYSLNEKGQSAPVSVCMLFSIWGRHKAWKCCPQAMSVCVGLEVTEARDQILFMVAPLAGSFFAGLHWAVV